MYMQPCGVARKAAVRLPTVLAVAHTEIHKRRGSVLVIMPEPFSIAAGVFALTVGTLGLLLNSVDKVVNTSQKLRECRE